MAIAIDIHTIHITITVICQIYRCIVFFFITHSINIGEFIVNNIWIDNILFFTDANTRSISAIKIIFLTNTFVISLFLMLSWITIQCRITMSLATVQTIATLASLTNIFSLRCAIFYLFITFTLRFNMSTGAIIIFLILLIVGISTVGTSTTSTATTGGQSNTTSDT